MTTRKPTSQGPSSLDRAVISAAEPSNLVRLAPEAQPRVARGKGGESVVVITNTPARTHLVISLNANGDAAPGSLAGMTVAVRAIPCDPEEEELPTRMFDRNSVLPDFLSRDPTAARSPASEALDASAELANAVPSRPSHVTQLSARELATQEPAPKNAQDTWRHATQFYSPQRVQSTSPWFALSAGCLLASALALYGVLPAAEDQVGNARGLQARPLAAAVSVEQPAPTVPVVTQLARPSAPKPVRSERMTPNARIDLDGLSLNVTSSPWMEVLLDGKSLGNTPKLRVLVKEGVHQITLRNVDLGLSTRAVVSAEHDAAETQEIAFE